MAAARTDRFFAASGAFPAFYDAHVRDVLVFFARRLIDAEAALDLTSETFAQAFARRGSFRGGSEAEARSWVFTIAHRQLAGYLRRGYVDRRARRRLGVQLGVPEPDELARIEELADLGGQRAAIADRLQALSADQRRAIELRVVDELPYPEVALALGVSEQTARARVSRALRAMRVAMGDVSTQRSADS